MPSTAQTHPLRPFPDTRGLKTLCDMRAEACNERHGRRTRGAHRPVAWPTGESGADRDSYAEVDRPAPPSAKKKNALKYTA